MNILDLKFLQVFFKNRGEILVFEKMLNFLSFLVLLYVSGHFKQKKIFEFFFQPTDRKNLQIKMQHQSEIRTRAIGAPGPNIRQIRKYVCHGVMLHTLICYVMLCNTKLGYVRNISACALKKVR